MIATTKEQLRSTSKMKDVGEASFVFGIKMIRDHSMKLFGLCQKTYIKKVFEWFEMHNCKSIDTPIAKGEC